MNDSAAKALVKFGSSCVAPSQRLVQGDLNLEGSQNGTRYGRTRLVEVIQAALKLLGPYHRASSQVREFD
ncbi:hypothetical protein [Paracoccus fontiphilus]|uniref:Uncharacterized protein n=1 Tax=Paracoccus fontiphilus TaxID=1815556 RepID=A0ABV7IG95_9RHOB|nr:hypothetical protein [Paracoccus fontiphilus]